MRLSRMRSSSSSSFASFVSFILWGAACILPCVLLTAPAVRAQEDVGSAIMAIVNKDVITSKQVTERADALLKEAGRNVPEAQRAEVRRNIIRDTVRDLVEERLLVAEARRMTETFPAVKRHLDGKVEERLQQERLDAGGELEFQEKLRAMGQTVAGYSEKIREEYMQREVISLFVMRDLTAGPAELHEYYREHPEQCREPAQVKYRQIFIRAANFESRDKARAQAAEIAALLAKQYDFAELARKYSNDGHESDGGLWDFQAQGTRPEPIDKALFSLEPGKVSEPIETDIGFTIVRVEERREGRMRPFDEVQPQIEQLLLARKRNERYQALIQRLYNENHVETVNSSTGY